MEWSALSDAESTEAFHGDRPAAASQQVLPDRSKLALVAVERTRMPMVVTDPRQLDNPIVLANKAFLDLTGYSAGEVLGRNCRFLQGKGTSLAVVGEIRRAITEESELEIEILNYRKDGSAFWNQLGLSPVHDDDGKLLYFFASQIDVTDLRKVQSLEASERRLLMEVDHRANNMLAIVNSIVHLSSSDDPAIYAEAIQRRIHVLARAHNLLAHRGWKEVSLSEVLVGLLGHLDPSRVAFNGARVMISPHAVQPISLAAHELADNALRHGALSESNGTVDVTWTDFDPNGRLELHWRERGGPPPPANPPRGFGGSIIAGMVELQLHGELKREWTPDGLFVLVRLPGQSLRERQLGSPA